MGTTIDSTSVSTDQLQLSSPNVPATPTSEGAKGDFAWDENFFYICIANNVWARTNINIAW